MKVEYIVADIATDDSGRAARFHRDVPGLDVLMDHGRTVTYGSGEASVQVSAVAQAGARWQVPDLTAEVDDVDEALTHGQKAGIGVKHSPIGEARGVCRCHGRDPLGKSVEILPHV